jgi:cell wall-associated NlpC family hydrolase
MSDYFDDPVKAATLKAEARSWIGTPFRECYHLSLIPDVKGIGGGIDCIGLVQEIFLRIGATEPFIFKREPADYQSHQLGEKVLDWLRGKADDPQSKRLGAIFEEREIPDQMTEPDAITPRDFFKPGDICVLKHGSLFHMPIVIDNDLHIVNALPRLGVVEGTMQDSTFSRHLVAVFRLRS